MADAFTAGNFGPWQDGPDAAGAAIQGRGRVPRRLDLRGRRLRRDAAQPTTTTYVLTPDPTTGALTPWKTAADVGCRSTCPRPRAGRLGRRRRATGCCWSAASGPTASRRTRSGSRPLDTKTGKLGRVEAERADGRSATARRRRAPTARPPSSARTCSSSAARDASGPTTIVMRGDIGSGRLGGSGVASPRRAPAARAAQRSSAGPQARASATCRSRGPMPPASRPTARSTSSAAIGRHRRRRASCTGPCPTRSGNIPEWKHLDASDLPPPGLPGPRAVVSGADVFLIGGRPATGRHQRRRCERTSRRSRRSSSSASSAPRSRPSRSRARSASSWATSRRPASGPSTSSCCCSSAGRTPTRSGRGRSGRASATGGKPPA